MPNDQAGGTVLDRFVESLTSAANISRASQARPRAMLPYLLTLGDRRPKERQDPAIWIKCALAPNAPAWLQDMAV